MYECFAYMYAVSRWPGEGLEFWMVVSSHVGVRN